MRCLSLFASLVLLRVTSCAPAQAADDSDTISLGGLRKVTAQIASDRGNFEIYVRMIAVRAFDTATNDRCNREKAIGFAILALKQHLVPDARKASLKISGQEVIDSSYDGRVFQLTLRLPRDGVAITDAKAKPPPAALPSKKRQSAEVDQEAVASVGASSLLTAKQDYLDTIAVLSAKWRERLPDRPDDEAEAKSFYGRIADAEEGVAADFAVLAKEVKTDKKLLSIEVREVLAAAEEKEHDLIGELAKRVNAFEGQSE